jgi:uncharacterized membrane protein
VTRLIIPNFHAVLIHFPLGMFGIGIIIELLSFVWGRSSLRAAGRWMILLGALAMIPAATTGIGAAADMMSHGQQGDQTWIKLRDSSGFTTFDWRLLRYHIYLNGIAAGISLLTVVAWVGASDAGRRALYLPAMLLLLIASGLIVDGAWHGGEMVYRQGFGVEGRKATFPPDNAPATENSEQKNLDDKIQAVVPAFDVHLLLAGLTISAAALALGLTIRRSVTLLAIVVPHVGRPVVVEPARARPRNPEPISLMGALHEPEAEIIVPPRLPTARLWVLAIVITILTLVSGLWFGGFIVGGSKVINFDGLRDAVQRLSTSPTERRMGLHIVMGGSILVLGLILMILARFAPRSRVILGLLSLLLLAVIATQVWTGILMLFDSDNGPLNRFKNASEVQAMNDADSTAPAMGMPSTMPAAIPSTKP